MTKNEKIRFMTIDTIPGADIDPEKLSEVVSGIQAIVDDFVAKTGIPVTMTTKRKDLH